MRIVPAALAILLLAIGCRTPREPTPASLGTLRDEAGEALGRGEFDRLGEIAQKGLDDSERLGDPDWIWWFRHLRFEYLINSGRESELLPILDGAPPDHLLARILIDRARANLLFEQYDDAEAELQKAATLSLAGEESLPIEFALTRADLLCQRESALAGERQYKEALQAARTANIPRLQIKAAGNLANLLEGRGELDQAAAAYELVFQGAQVINDKASIVRAQIGLGECQYRLGLFEKALETFRAARANASEAHSAALTSYSHAGLGNVFFHLRDFDSAIECYRLALQSAPNDRLRARWLNNLAGVHIELGLWTEAQKYIDQAMPLKERSGEANSKDYPLVNQAEIFIGLGKVEEATEVLSQLLAREDSLTDEILWETYACLGEIAAMRGDEQQASRNYRLALDQIDRGRERLNREESQISFRSKWNHFSQSYVNFLVDQGQIAKALESAEASRAVVLREGLGIRPTLLQSGATRLQVLAKRLDAVLLSYWVAPKRSFLWVATGAEIKLFVLPGSKEIDSLVEGYRNYLLRYLDPIGPGGASNSYSVELFDRLVRPALDMIPRGSNVILVPDGSLHSLNFETLLTTGDDNPHYWIEDVTLSVAPSLAIVQPDPPRGHADRSLLLIGDPTVADEAYPALSGVKTEIENVSRQFDERDRVVIVGQEAVPEAYARSHPDRYQWVHFAAHAVANPVDPLGSSVILSPRGDSYRLFAHDVEEVRLDASVVTLSACRSAGAKAYSGEGLVGFAWAFLKAGAHNVVAGLWDVDDKAGAKLMELFYAGMLAGKSPAAALRQAKLQLLRTSGEWAKPVYWAPFQIYTRFSPFVQVRRATADINTNLGKGR